MGFSWKNLFKKHRFLIVAIKEFPVKNGLNKEGVVFVYFYENKNGNRKIKYSCSIEPTEYSSEENQQKYLLSYLKTLPRYHKEIYPWLNGTNIETIPTWFDAFKKNNKKQVKEIYKRYFSEY